MGRDPARGGLRVGLRLRRDAAAADDPRAGQRARPDELRGRYNALSSGAFQLAAIIAPPIAGFLVAHDLGAVYIGSLVAGCLLCGAIAVVRLEPQLSPEVNRRPRAPRGLDPQELSAASAKTISAATD